jgi:hypothetical protein
MKYYAPENASFLLPFKFDADLLHADLLKCMKYEFLKNYIPQNYDGKDYILSLRSIEGRLNMVSAMPDNLENYKDTIALEQCHYFQQVIAKFNCQKEAIRLMNLPPGKIINTHTDPDCGYEDGVFRIHIPIMTNDKVYFVLNDQTLSMKAGEVWYTNVNLPHSVANNGQSNRVHLVIDCVRNKWSDKLFKAIGYDFHQERELEESMTKNEVLRIIEELEIQNSKESRLFLKQFKIDQGIIS